MEESWEILNQSILPLPNPSSAMSPASGEEESKGTELTVTETEDETFCLRSPASGEDPHRSC